MASVINAFGINPNLISLTLIVSILGLLSIYVFYKLFSPKIGL